MINARAWVTLCAVAASVGLLTASCGSDELNGSGGTIVGSGGVGGGANRGGAGGVSSSGGKSNTGGTGGTTGKSSNLGKACVTDANCGAAPLFCYNQPDVPQGFCTTECSDNSECQAISAGSVCAGPPQGFCVQGCTVGSASLTQKCQGRDDFTCQLFDVDQSGIKCAKDADCAPAGPAYFCSSQRCLATACLPTCANDAECGDGYCNIGSGFCEMTPPKGLPLGSACDVNATTDPCSGLCIGDSSGSFSLCSGLCNLGLATACGWDGTGKADGACLFGQAFNDMPDVGDAGYCAQLCDCTTDCRNPKFSCVALSANEAKVVGRAGFCTLPEAGSTDVVISKCPATGTGAGGAGGVSGSAGAGPGGEGGVPASSSGGTNSSGGATSSGGSAGASGSGGAGAAAG